MTLEKVQNRDTKIIGSLKDKPYVEMLNALNLQGLEDRRLRGDVFQTFKIVNGFYKINLVN